MLILIGDELLPLFLLILAQNLIIMEIQFDRILLQVLEQVISAQHLSNLHQLVIIVTSVEKRVFVKQLTQITAINTTIEANIAPVLQMSSE